MDGGGNRKDSPSKGGKVNEMCREWLVREDGAFAYHLQAQEISQHYSGNKNRNQQVREDFPCALDEQLREQHLAEQAAAVYQRMLMEQEEVDQQVARELAERMEREEALRRRAAETRDENLARQMQQVRAGGDRRERTTVEYVGNQPRRQAPQMPLPKSRIVELAVQQRQASNGVDRTDRGVGVDNTNIAPLPPPKPAQAPAKHTHAQMQQQKQLLPGSADDYHDLYMEPYQPASPLSPPDANLCVLTEQMLRMDVAEGDTDKDQSPRSVTFPSVDDAAAATAEEEEAEEERRRLRQEERDAEFARRLQEEETNSEENIMIRDRMLAMEAQDKELARLLQEREKAKARRAKERARQRALQKKMALEQHPQHLIPGSDNHPHAMVLLPDDSYSNPADLLPPKTVIPHTMDHTVGAVGAHEPMTQHDDDDEAASNYSLPVDTLVHQNVTGSVTGSVTGPHARPTHLHLRSTTAPSVTTPTKVVKPRYPDPPPALGTLGACPAPQHTNIAMAIDPTYSRRQQLPGAMSGYYQQPSTYPPHHQTQYCSNGHGGGALTAGPHPNTLDPTPCTPPTFSDSGATCSDSGGGGGGSPVPPYMPIQGQRRGGGLANAALDGPMGLGQLMPPQQMQSVVASSGGGGGGKGRKGKGGKDGGGGCKQQ